MPEQLAKYLGEWHMGNSTIAYCLSRIMPESCEVSMSLRIMVVITVCNCAKLLLMLVTISNIGKRQLLTVGDAIASFLETPEEHIRDLYSRNRNSETLSAPNTQEYQPLEHADSHTAYMRVSVEHYRLHTSTSSVVEIVTTNSTIGKLLRSQYRWSTIM